MTPNNSYLESFEMMAVEKYMSGMTKTEIMRRFGISTSTLDGWKLKYKELVRADYVPAAKASLAKTEFVDATKPRHWMEAMGEDTNVSRLASQNVRKIYRFCQPTYDGD